MKILYQALPIVVGVALGILLVDPPGWFDGLGAWRYAVLAALAAVLFFGFVVVMAIANLPSNLAIKALPRLDLSGVQHLVRGFESMGFSRLGSPLELALKPPAHYVPFLDDEECKTYGGVARLQTTPSRTFFELISITEESRGSLTTTTEPLSATMPAMPGRMRQVLVGANLPSAIHQHRQTLKYLEAKGLRFREHSAETLLGDIRYSMVKQREHFLTAPLRHTLILLWRTMTRRIPELGPLERQRDLRRHLEAIQTSRSFAP